MRVISKPRRNDIAASILEELLAIRLSVHFQTICPSFYSANDCSQIKNRQFRATSQIPQASAGMLNARIHDKYKQKKAEQVRLVHFLSETGSKRSAELRWLQR